MIKYAVIFIVLVIVFTYLFYSYYNIQNKLKYKLKITGINPKEGFSIELAFSLILQNFSDGQITFKDLEIELYNKGVLLAKSPLKNDKSSTVIGRAGSGIDKIEYNDKLNIVLSGQLVNLAMSLLNSNEIKIDYIVRLKATVFDIPFTYSDSYIFKR